MVYARATFYQTPCVGLAQCPKRVWLGNVTRRPRKSRSFAEGIGTVMRIHVALSFDQVSGREPLLRRLEKVAPNEKGAPIQRVSIIMEAPTSFIYYIYDGGYDPAIFNFFILGK